MTTTTSDPTPRDTALYHGSNVVFSHRVLTASHVATQLRFNPRMYPRIFHRLSCFHGRFGYLAGPQLHLSRRKQNPNASSEVRHLGA